MAAEPVTPDLAARKATELRAKLAGLREELETWESDTATGATLRKHCTQVRALLLNLDAPIAAVGAGLDDAGAEPIDIEREILEIHRLWDFFRGKLAQRYVPRFGPFLAGADAFAWRCYEPAANLLPSPGREPPLVFLNGGSSPFTLPRSAPYEAEDVPDERVRSNVILTALQTLPFAVIGVPWFQVEYLPDMPVIGHEVGHDVEADLLLETGVHQAIRGAVGDEARRRHWLQWRSEVFADVYGTLAAGPAFTSSLIDFLAGLPESVAVEPLDPDYPTRTLRIMLSTEVLRKLGFDEDATRLREAWSKRYPSHSGAAFEQDVPAVATAVIATPYATLGCKPLTQLLTFTPAMQRDAETAASDAARKQAPSTGDVRVLVAAARIAFDGDAATYAAAGVPGRILRRIEAIEGRATRATGDVAPEEAARDARDRASSERLAALLAGDAATPEE